MTEPYIIYNGVDSRDLGVVIEKMPDFDRPARIVQLEQVPGRDGRCIRDEGVYDACSTNMKINCFGVDLSNVYRWLSGSGWMISSDEPNRAMRVSLHGQIKDSRYRCGGCYDSLTVPVYYQPYRYHWPEPDGIEVTATPGIIQNSGTALSMPKIKIFASGDVTVMIGLCQMDFEGLTDGIIVDSEWMDCYDLTASELLNAKAEMDEFPILSPGANPIQWTGEVSKIIIEPRCRDL